MENVINLLRESGAMLEGHFLLSSGLHSDKYFQCAKLLQYPQKAQAALDDVVKKIKEEIKLGKFKVDIIAGPAMGGIIAAWEVARQMGLPSIFTERDENGIMTLRRGFELQEGQNILIVEDTITTGKSSHECVEAIEKTGAKAVALACIVDRRSQQAEEFRWPFYPAVKITANNWQASECILCKQGLPAVKPGSRRNI
ncbi:MAG: orotate phosphoribosyltransferase [Treponema sp.]|nr:orotate phosphoribosyltransferase [Treponema sp.]